MGGDAVDNVRRYEADEYHALKDEVVATLKGHLPNTVRVQDLLAYRCKQSFGDLDLLVELTVEYPNKQLLLASKEKDCWTPFLKEVFQSKHVKCHHENMLSFEFREFQVDVNFVTTDQYDTSYHYYAYNDLGNFLGRVAHQLGFKYGHKGLLYVLPEEYNLGHGTALPEISVTTDVEAALTFLGYNYQTFLTGFDTLEEIFVFATTSEYFNSSVYLFENRDSVSRRRDRKRKNYHLFLEYLADNQASLPNFPYNKATKVEFQREQLHRAFSLFPAFQHRYDRAVHRAELRKKCKDVFNGKVVSEVVNKSGAELGMVMKHLRERMNATSDKKVEADEDEFYVEKFASMTLDEVKYWVRSSYSNSEVNSQES